MQAMGSPLRWRKPKEELQNDRLRGERVYYHWTPLLAVGNIVDIGEVCASASAVSVVSSCSALLAYSIWCRRATIAAKIQK